jgi:hypothetical protein
VQHEKQDRNLFGIVNAVTRAGQTFDNTNWVKFDGLGGELLDMTEGGWSAIKQRADSYTDKEIEKVFVTV